MNILREIILWTWCFPQTFLGILLLIKVYIQRKIINVELYRGIFLIKTKDSKILAGISLGKFIFVNESRIKSGILEHEYGHTIQGYFLGPLYLLIIGIPSVFLVFRFHLIKNFTREDYHNSFPEKWADQLGKVNKK